jgi:hypothetical protein
MLNLQLTEDPVREIPNVFLNLKNLTIEFYMDAHTIPLIQAVSLESLNIIHEASNDIDSEGLKVVATSYPNLKKFSFFEMSLSQSTWTDLTDVILSISAHIEIIELREVECNFLKNTGMDFLPEFPQLSQLTVTDRCNKDDFDLFIDAKKLLYVYLILDGRDVSCITVKDFPSLEVLEVSSSAVSLVLESVPSLMFLKIDGVLESIRADSPKKLVCMMYKPLVSFSAESAESQTEEDISVMNRKAKIFDDRNQI